MHAGREALRRRYEKEKSSFLISSLGCLLFVYFRRGLKKKSEAVPVTGPKPLK